MPSAARGQVLFDLLRQAEDAKEVGDGRALFAHPPGKVFLGQLELVLETLERFGRLEGVQVLALDVLDKGLLDQLAFGRFSVPARDGFEPGEPRGRPPPPFAGNEPIAAAAL